LGAAGHPRIVEQDLGFGKLRMVIVVLLKKLGYHSVPALPTDDEIAGVLRISIPEPEIDAPPLETPEQLEWPPPIRPNGLLRPSFLTSM
jgi:hypothetical protein